ncbi:cell division cycle 123 family protein [Archangium violaceum]|uniref:cell division cycle 123 family protein n=1 Tax=Archangium violaceum TaxID=83451 RepID=UPI001EEFB3C6|nr:cell division cycle 123 family protein [Archangium violaceum]
MSYVSWSRAYFERIRPTFLESWTKDLRALAVSQVHLPLTLVEARALSVTPPLWRERLVALDPEGLHSIAARLQKVLEGAEQGVFVRLGSGSPKDSALFRDHGGCARTPMMALKFLQTSPRTRAHLSRFLELGHPVHLFVRHWMQIPPWQEFRCFMHNRRLVGISQLAHWGDTPDYSLAPRAEEIARTLRDFFVRVAQVSHLGSAVFDVLCDSGAGDGASVGVWLLDANPWGPASDACLFDWSQPEGFDGSFRYLK